MARQVEAVFEQGVLRPLEPLALAEHQHVRLTLEEEPGEGGARGRTGKPGDRVQGRREELPWLARESAAYTGEWGGPQGSRLIAHGAKLLDVNAAARAAGVADPLFASVPEAQEVPFAGWQAEGGRGAP